jgi:hypothetical protein
MNETSKTSIVHMHADDSRIWYPLNPRWIPLLRLAGALGLLGIIYSVASQRPWSLASLGQWCVPAILALFCLFTQPELRAPTVLNRIGRGAHHLLVFLVLPLAILMLPLALLLLIIDWLLRVH